MQFGIIIAFFCLFPSTFAFDFVHLMQNRGIKDGKCPEVPKDVAKGKSGEICYMGGEGERVEEYRFTGQKIAGEPDSKVSGIRDWPKITGIKPESSMR